jgi:hypothetical protein
MSNILPKEVLVKSTKPNEKQAIFTTETKKTSNEPEKKIIITQKETK